MLAHAPRRTHSRQIYNVSHFLSGMVTRIEESLQLTSLEEAMVGSSTQVCPSRLGDVGLVRVGAIAGVIGSGMLGRWFLGAAGLSAAVPGCVVTGFRTSLAANQALLPTSTVVTPAAAHQSRRP